MIFCFVIGVACVFLAGTSFNKEKYLLSVLAFLMGVYFLVATIGSN